MLDWIDIEWFFDNFADELNIIIDTIIAFFQKLLNPQTQEDATGEE